MSEAPNGLSPEERDAIDKLFKRLPTASHYELLGVAREADTGEIINGLNQRRRQFDLRRLRGVPGPEYTSRIEAVLSASEESAATLLDPVRRFLYDQELAKGIPTRRNVRATGGGSPSTAPRPIPPSRAPTPLMTQSRAPTPTPGPASRTPTPGPVPPSRNPTPRPDALRGVGGSILPPPSAVNPRADGAGEYIVPPPFRRPTLDDPPSRPSRPDTVAPPRPHPRPAARPASQPPPPLRAERPPSSPPPARVPSAPPPKMTFDAAAEVDVLRREVRELAAELERVTVALQLSLAQWLEPDDERLESMAHAMATLNGARGTVLMQEARAEEQRGQWATAADLWIRAARARSDDPLPRVRVSECLRRMGDFDGAAQYAEQALRIDPDCAEAHATLALLAAMADVRGGR
ncbi:MAG: hypothetical protein R3A52_20320 [Polyangiales bacterium]